ncbi:hypothetical protein BDB00DRAFT_850597 [Zychaea mexicana]|uniref:uncharacterized protein n=1 Tax=Zychaea mexicana TaxID=64656 RepID=UPI0022FF3BEC|nr:uncharacterized protein BDB00DRAFT_850597 [Zychaea mexicana]KAI9488000.1 hypothetical protein BDB00DRAFT_850597 [Zychaea mexicana]
MDIPTSFIVSSKLSPLEPADIPRIVHLAKQKCRPSCLERRMRKHPKTPIMAVGISNLHDMQRVMTADVPVIHIQQDCLALRGAQLRHTRELKYCRVVEGLLSSGLWALYFAAVTTGTRSSMMKRRFLYVPMILTAYTAYFLRTSRRDYTVLEDNASFVLVRNDVRRSRVQFVLRTWVPYCILGVFDEACLLLPLFKRPPPLRCYSV